MAKKNAILSHFFIFKLSVKYIFANFKVRLTPNNQHEKLICNIFPNNWDNVLFSKHNRG